MSKSRVPLAIGLAGAGGIGYYLFSAGGNPKAAEKKFEADAHRAAATAKAHLPGNSPDAKNYGKEAGAKIDNAIAEADRQAGRAKSNVEALAKDARAEGLKAVDKFDAKVEEGAAKAKGWFGGSK
ncbi:hypothetical protein CC79DRAFT_1324974 [Sarocladium strictum]